MNDRITRIAVSALIAAGTFTATLAGAAQTASPALADSWHGGDHGGDHGGWHGQGGRPDGSGYRPAPPRYVRAGSYGHPYGWHRDAYAYRGPRYFDRVHGYWRDRAGYWNRAGVYITFRL